MSVLVDKWSVPRALYSPLLGAKDWERVWPAILRRCYVLGVRDYRLGMFGLSETGGRMMGELDCAHMGGVPAHPHSSNGNDSGT
jgi:hypothetical protein